MRVQAEVITIYHHLDPRLQGRMTNREFARGFVPLTRDLELAAVVEGTDDLDEAFDRTIHRDAEHWTDEAGIVFFGDRRGRRSTREGDVFVDGHGAAFLVLPLGFQPLPGMRLPFLGGQGGRA